MEKEKQFVFVISEESVNDYDCIVLNDGLDVSLFAKNPIMLYMHERGNVIGRWHNVRLEDGKWLADAEFDMEDEQAAKLAGKVERGYLKSCSVGIKILDAYLNDADIVVITKAELMEVSLVDIPANKSAVLLYDQQGTLIAADKTINLSQILTTYKPKTIHRMSKLNGLLGLAAEATEEQQEVAVALLLSYKKKFEDLDAAVKQQKQQRAVSLMDAAVADGWLSALQRPAYAKLFDADFETTETVLAGLPKPVSLSAYAQAGATKADMDLAKEYDERDKAGTLLVLKQSNPELFNAMFKARWGKMPR